MRTKLACVLVVGLMVAAAIVLVSTPQAEAATFSSNIRVNDVTTADQLNAAAATDASGTIHVVWQDYRGPPGHPAIYYAHSSDGGKVFSGSIPVDNAMNPSQVSQRYPSIAVSDNGWVHVIWLDLTNKGNQIGSHIYYARSKAGGATFSTKTSISGNLDPSADFYAPQLVRYDGRIPCALHAIWSPVDIAAANGLNLWYSTSALCGDAWAAEASLATSVADAQVNTSASDGEVGVVYVGGPVTAPNIFVIIGSGGTWQPPVT